MSPTVDRSSIQRKEQRVAFSRADIRFIFFGFILIGLRLASSATADLAHLLLIFYALRGREQAIHALLFSWLFVMINPGLAPVSPYAGLLRYATVLAALISVFGRRRRRQRIQARRFLSYTALLGGFLLVHSMAISPIPDVSILKALSWTMTILTLLAAWQGLEANSLRRLEWHVFGLLIALLIFSLPLSVSSFGYIVNGTGFQGVLNHPQAFGPTMAVLGAWAAARLFSESKPAWWIIILLAVCLVVILASEARTAGFSLVLGVVLSLLLSPIFAGRPFMNMVPGLRSRRVMVMSFLVLVTSVVMAPVISEKIHHYITKSGRADVGNVMEAYDDSRGAGIRLMLQNFNRHPYAGIGFGIASIPESMNIRRDPFFNLPMSASVEKGVTPIAVLEELGFFGALLFGGWVVMLLKGSARSGLVPFAVCLAILLINIGEATLFSPGGMGMLYLILLAWAYARGQAAIQRKKAIRNDI